MVCSWFLGSLSAWPGAAVALSSAAAGVAAACIAPGMLRQGGAVFAPDGRGAGAAFHGGREIQGSALTPRWQLRAFCPSGARRITPASALACAPSCEGAGRLQRPAADAGASPSAVFLVLLTHMSRGVVPRPASHSMPGQIVAGLRAVPRSPSSRLSRRCWFCLLLRVVAGAVLCAGLLKSFAARCSVLR